MRLILKTSDNTYITFYWVTYTGNAIVGWYSGNWLRKELGLPEDMHFESHFNYPKDGNYHYSYKAINQNYEQYISVYWDKVKIKTIENGIKEIILKTRKEFEDNILNHMVGNFQPLPIVEATFFQFTNVAVTVFNGKINTSKFDKIIKEEDIKKDDIVVDISDMDNIGLNICALIRHSSQEVFKPSNGLHFSKSIVLPNDRYLDLVCNATEN